MCRQSLPFPPTHSSAASNSSKSCLAPSISRPRSQSCCARPKKLLRSTPSIDQSQNQNVCFFEKLTPDECYDYSEISFLCPYAPFFDHLFGLAGVSLPHKTSLTEQILCYGFDLDRLKATAVHRLPNHCSVVC